MLDAFRAIYFDCDSTLSTLEGIDELARGAGPAAHAEIAAMTEAAMDGRLRVEDAYARRLEIVRPSQAAVAAVGRAYVAHLVPDTEAVVGALQALGKEVGIVSGGLRPAVCALAQAVGIDAAHVHAVDVAFDHRGAFRDFERTNPLARSGGKADVLAAIARHGRPLAFVGDGVTDLEAAPAVDRFIGFGGVVRRAPVAAAAECFADGPSLASVLQFCLTPAERTRLRGEPRFRHLLPGATP